MAIEMRLDFAGQVAPRDPAGGGVGDGTKDPDEAVGVLLRKYMHPLRPATVQGRFNVGEHSGQPDPALVSLSKSMAALLLVFAQLEEPLFHGGLGFDGLLEPPLLTGHLVASTSGGIVVSSSPPSPAGLLRPTYRVVNTVLGVPAGNGRGDQLPSGPGPVLRPGRRGIASMSLRSSATVRRARRSLSIPGAHCGPRSI